MIVETLAVGALKCNCTIFGDEQTKEAMVVDPGDGGPDQAAIQGILDRHGLTVTAIIITHAHIDHIGGAAKLKAKTGAPVYMNANDQPLYAHLETQADWLGMETPERTSIDVDSRDGDALRLGEANFQVIHTPGHSPGSQSLYSAELQLLVAGDTLFRDSIGRTDLPGGNTRQIMSSIHNKLMRLPEETRVICGHGPSTTLCREKDQNPFLQPGGLTF